MTSLLLTISFLIHILLLIGMYSLYKEIQLLKSKNSNANEIAEVFEAYLKEIKAENERLEEMSSLSTTMKPKTNDMIKEEVKPSHKNIPMQVTVNDHILNTPNIEDELETTLESKVLQLANQGFTSEEIAEKLNCGKTEAELIIKLYSKIKS